MRCHLLAASFASMAITAFAHDGDHDFDTHRSTATIQVQGDKRIIDSNGLPDHQPGQFPNRGNPNSIVAQSYHFEMPLHPQASSAPRPLRHYLFGVAVNGVVFDPGTAEVWLPGEKIQNRPGPGTRLEPARDRRRAWNYEGMGRMNLGIDANHAHVQPTGAYHYHGLPTGLIDRLRTKRGDNEMLLIGYAADGYPIYAEFGYEKPRDAASPLKKLQPSYRLKVRQRPTGDAGPGGNYDGTFVQDYEFVAGSGDLDECNGREGITPEYPDGTYYYVATDTFPFIPRFFHGTPDSTFAKRGPGQGLRGRDRHRGRPPFRGVSPLR
jgi:hypothetical protein